MALNVLMLKVVVIILKNQIVSYLHFQEQVFVFGKMEYVETSNVQKQINL